MQSAGDGMSPAVELLCVVVIAVQRRERQIRNISVELREQRWEYAAVILVVSIVRAVLLRSLLRL